MGKERVGAIITATNIKKDRFFVNKAQLQKEAAKQWALSQGVVHQADINEDGAALVTVRNDNIDTDVVCSGISNEGNTQAFLVQLLKKKSLVPKKSQTQTMFLFKNFVWSPFNPATSTFRSGDRLMLIVEDSKVDTKKSIKHI